MIKRLKKSYFRNKTIIENFSYLSILQFINLAIPLISYPYLIRVLGKETYGLVIFAQAIVSYLVILVNFGFNISATKEISLHRENKNEIEKIVTSVLVLKGFLFLISLGILSILLFIIPKAGEYKILFYLSMYVCLYDWLFPVWYFQGVEKMKYITLITLISRSIFLILIFLLIHGENDYLFLPLINGIGAVFGSIIALYIIFFKEKISLKKTSLSDLKYYFRASVPIFVSNVSIKIYVSSNKIIIGSFLGMADVAYYDLAEKLVGFLKMPQNILTQTVFPKISKDKNLRFVRKLFNISVLINIIVFILLVIFVEPIVLFIGGQDMTSAIPVLIILSISIPVIAMSNVFGIQLLLPFGFNRTFRNVIISSAVFYSFSILFLYFGYGFTVESIAIINVLTEIFVALSMYYYCLKNKLWIRNLII